MPHVPLYKSELGLDVGLSIGPFAIKQSNIQHVPKVPFESYEFPIKLILESEGTAASEKEAKQALALHLPKEGKKLIYSEQGSPYDCSFGTPRFKKLNEKEIQVTSLGNAKRRRDILTKSQELRAKQTDTEREEEAKLKRQLKGKMRFLKSRWNTSTCPICSQRIESGQTIAQAPQGWSHIKCAALENSETLKNEADGVQALRSSKRKQAEIEAEERELKKKRPPQVL